MIMNFLNRNLITATLASICILTSIADAQTCPQTLLAAGPGTGSFPAAIRQGRTFVYDGLLLEQAFDGNLQLFTGELGKKVCKLWESGRREPQEHGFTYTSLVRQDGRLTTRLDNATGTRITPNIFVTPNPNQSGSFYFTLTCDGVIGLYNASVPTANNSVWISQINRECPLTEILPPPPQPPCQRAVVLRSGSTTESEVKTNLVTGGILDLGNGAYIQQQFSGNVAIKSSSNNETLWQSCASTESGQNFATQLQTDSNLITRPGLDRTQNIWRRGDFNPNTNHPWELALECNTEGTEWDEVVISDPEGGNVQWRTPLRRDCATDSAPVCASAVILLPMDGRIRSNQNSGILQTNKGYYLKQLHDGTLQVIKDVPESSDCVVWQNLPRQPTQVSEFAETVMQNDGNLVTYGRNVFQVLFDHGTRMEPTSAYYFVVDDCLDDPVVGVYRGDPTSATEVAELLWSIPFTHECIAPRQTLRGRV